MSPLHRRFRRLLATGLATLALALPTTLLTFVMGFHFDPTEVPPDYWPGAVTRYRVVLIIAVILASVGVTCFIGMAVIARGEFRTLVSAAGAALLGIALVLSALRGALPAIEQAQMWSTSPPI